MNTLRARCTQDSVFSIRLQCPRCAARRVHDIFTGYPWRVRSQSTSMMLFVLKGNLCGVGNIWGMTVRYMYTRVSPGGGGSARGGWRGAPRWRTAAPPCRRAGCTAATLPTTSRTNASIRSTHDAHETLSRRCCYRLPNPIYVQPVC